MYLSASSPNNTEGLLISKTSLAGMSSLPSILPTSFPDVMSRIIKFPSDFSATTRFSDGYDISS